MPHAFDDIFPIGLGCGRFPFFTSETYPADLENAVDLVLYALDRGVNYIDVGKGYSTGKAFSVLKEAFRRTDKPFHVTVKVNVYDEHDTAEDYYQEALFVLNEMGLEKASHFLLWTLMDSRQFHRAVREDGLYDTALRLKEEGRIEHIGASVHMRPDDIIEVIDSGLFEFVLVSYHLLNFLDMRRVLDRAYEKGVDILVMNPLYGGLIPENQELFEYVKFWDKETVVQASVRALLSHPAVKCVLAGASSRQQFDEYLSAVADPAFNEHDKTERLRAVTENTTNSETFCSYCRYCADCPKKIPVPEIMNARNSFLVKEQNSQSSSAQFFRSLNEKFDLDFESSENPCVKCGQCERKCTQHLPIIQSVDEIYQLVRKTSYDMQSRKKRFDELLHRKEYQKVGFWPASAGTIKILEIYERLFGAFPFEVYLFDSNVDYHGKEKFGYTVHAKEDAAMLDINCILITSFLYGRRIYEQIKDLEESDIAVKTLYREGDVDWWW